MLIDKAINLSFVVKFVYCKSTSGDKQRETLRGVYFSPYTVFPLSSHPLCLFRCLARANLRAEKDLNDRII